MISSRNKTIADVREFWNNNPLFSGEARHDLSSREWFIEHERIYISDCFAGHSPDSIFTDGLRTDFHVLDVGCGPGFWVRYFLRNGFRKVTACDLASTAIELTKRSLTLFGLQAGLAVANAEQLSYRENTFDHINCQGVIHHTPDTGQAVREFFRVLKPGGTLCFSVYRRNFLLRHPKLLQWFSLLFSGLIRLSGRGREALLSSGRADEIVRLYDGIDNPIGKAYTLVEIKEMLAGLFQIEDFAYFYFPARALPVAIARFLHGWLHNRHGLMIVIRGRKPLTLNGPSTSAREPARP